jgi:hypothetical protein
LTGSHRETLGRFTPRFLPEPRIVNGTDDRNFVRLYGPKLVSVRHAIGIIGKAIGKEVKVTQLDENEALEVFKKEIGMPRPTREQLTSIFKTRAEVEGSDDASEGSAYEEAVSNIPKYARRQPTRLEKRVEENMQEIGGWIILELAIMHQKCKQ